METIDDLLRSLGGNSKVGAVLGKGQTTISEMKRRRSIPVRYWPALLKAAEAIGLVLTEGDLVRLHTVRPINSLDEKRHFLVEATPL